ncbi:MAG: hypothetical protein LBS01_05155 [Prevotellaceae bacterium]|jgi:hypothetical protein|nr:hypothetical protein [Prevotellaceae bacterium]
MKKVKFSNLAGKDEANFMSNNKTALKAEELAYIFGGAGCNTTKREETSSDFCEAVATCTSGVRSEGIVVVQPPITLVCSSSIEMTSNPCFDIVGLYRN